MFRLKKNHNKLLKDLMLLIFIMISLGVILGSVFYDSSYFSKEGHFVSQPIAFSHRFHADDLGLACQFCHVHENKNSSMGMPSSETCYGCHQEILKDSNYLKPVRDVYINKTSLHWTRVNDLADHVHFDHGRHVENGISCTRCHGDVAQMPLTAKSAPMTMQWCLQCHGERGNKNRPPDSHLVLKDCYTCHR